MVKEYRHYNKKQIVMVILKKEEPRLFYALKAQMVELLKE